MILKDFAMPADEYGEVSFFWWQGDDITKEKLSWILEQLKEKHICGLQINYCHGDKGGQLYGLTMESNPRPFSEKWWELVGWFIEECKKNKMAVSLSDYTLGSPGQGFYIDEVLKEHPEFIGQHIIKKDGKIQVETVPYSLNPMVKGVGAAVVDKFYGAFERHFPGELGKGVNYFFSDELNFNIRGNLWCDSFPEEFQKRKGYDIREEWEALFTDTGENTAKIRLDYYDVIVQLQEEAYFAPVYQWHESHGMTFGCDHGGRGRNVTEFGDYFRTMKWYQGPGNDQPHLAADVIKSKVSSSIAHLYQRPRVWLEGFYSSGWQTSAEDVADGVFRNFGFGHNLLSLHGLYYSTHGSMWEWAPPCNHYHMPYWGEMEKLLLCTKRLSYVISQGVHRCDVAVIYPVAAVEADKEQGKIAVSKAFDTASRLYRHGIDFDFIDFQSVERARVEGDRLCVSGEEYRYLILPDMKNVRYEMYRKLVDYSRNGHVVVLGEYPTGSDWNGKGDTPLCELNEQLKQNACNFNDAQEVEGYIRGQGDLDFTCETEQPYFLHRIIDGTDLYYLYGIKENSWCSFRALGIPVVYNPWDGKRYRLASYEVRENHTWFRMPVSDKELLLVAFEKDSDEISSLPFFPIQYDRTIEMDGICECEILPTMDNKYGDYRLPAGDYFIGPEAREMEYCFADAWENVKFEDKEQVTYGTYFFVCEGMESSEEEFIQMSAPMECFEPYAFSMKEGVKGDAGYQGSYHGLKGKLSDDFLIMGEKKRTMAGSSSKYIGEGIWYYYTTVYVNEKYQRAKIDTGELKPQSVWINHTKVEDAAVELKKGTNHILLKFNQSGRTHFVLKASENFVQNEPLVTRWYHNTDILPFDPYPEWEGKNCWYRFRTPPGAKSMRLLTAGETECFFGGETLNGTEGLYLLPDNEGEAGEVIVKIKQQRGFYGCAAILAPVSFETGKGKIKVPIDQEKNGLQFYSGGLRLAKTVVLEDLGKIRLRAEFKGCASKVVVNGKEAGEILAAPYTCDISDYVTPGENEIEVILYNSMHNHMKTIPTNFNFDKSPRGYLPYSVY